MILKLTVCKILESREDLYQKEEEPPQALPILLAVLLLMLQKQGYHPTLIRMMKTFCPRLETGKLK